MDPGADDLKGNMVKNWSKGKEWEIKIKWVGESQAAKVSERLGIALSLYLKAMEVL